MYVLSKNIKNIKIFLVKFSIFTAEKKFYILHGQVFVITSCAYRFTCSLIMFHQVTDKLLIQKDNTATHEQHQDKKVF